jgi:hypothetical protein
MGGRHQPNHDDDAPEVVAEARVRERFEEGFLRRAARLHRGERPRFRREQDTNLTAARLAFLDEAHLEVRRAAPDRLRADDGLGKSFHLAVAHRSGRDLRRHREQRDQSCREDPLRGRELHHDATPLLRVEPSLRND